jgi:S-formylglutathione hydrolase FrmB
VLSRRRMASGFGAAAVGSLLGAPVAFAHDPSSHDTRLWVTPAVNAPGLEQIVFASAAARGDVSFHVLSPPSLNSEPARRFPTLYWLHGTASAITSIRPMAALFTNAMRAGHMPQAFVVLPNGLRDSLWCNSHDGSMPVETILMREIIPLVDSRFRTIDHRSHRMIEGFSMGGFGAGRLGFRYPETFAAISMLGAGPLQAEFTRGSVAPNNRELQAHVFANVFGADQDYFRIESPRGLAAANAACLRTGSRIRVAVGDNDFSLAANRDFSTFLTTLAVPHDFIIVPRVGHSAMGLFEALGFGFHRSVLSA